MDAEITSSSDSRPRVYVCVSACVRVCLRRVQRQSMAMRGLITVLPRYHRHDVGGSEIIRRFREQTRT